MSTQCVTDISYTLMGYVESSYTAELVGVTSDEIVIDGVVDLSGVGDSILGYTLTESSYYSNGWAGEVVVTSYDSAGTAYGRTTTTNVVVVVRP